jgi:predicted enzyme related to lactoylglutathione lyase
LNNLQESALFYHRRRGLSNTACIVCKAFAAVLYWQKLLLEYINTDWEDGDMVLGEVGLLTNDVRRLAAFYKLLLEVDNQSDDPVHQALPVGETALTVYNDGSAKNNQNQNICLAFTVMDVDAEYQRLLTMGAVIVAPPATQPWGARNMCFLDPDNNQVYLRCFPAVR